MTKVYVVFRNSQKHEGDKCFCLIRSNHSKHYAEVICVDF